MTAIEGSISGFKDRVDGTLVLSIEIEPRFVKEALELFRVRGTAVALAALKPERLDDSGKPFGVLAGYQGLSVNPPEYPTEKSDTVGPLAKWLIMRCKEHEFFDWIAHHTQHPDWMMSQTGDTQEGVSKRIAMAFCGCVESRKEIDQDPVKTELFHRLIRGPYSKWLASR